MGIEKNVKQILQEQQNIKIISSVWAPGWTENLSCLFEKARFLPF